MRVLWLFCFLFFFFTAGRRSCCTSLPFSLTFIPFVTADKKKMGPYTYSSKEAREETVYVWVSRLVFLAHLGESMSGAHYLRSPLSLGVGSAVIDDSLGVDTSGLASIIRTTNKAKDSQNCCERSFTNVVHLSGDDPKSRRRRRGSGC